MLLPGWAKVLLKACYRLFSGTASAWLEQLDASLTVGSFEKRTAVNSKKATQLPRRFRKPHFVLASWTYFFPPILLVNGFCPGLLRPWSYYSILYYILYIDIDSKSMYMQYMVCMCVYDMFIFITIYLYLWIVHTYVRTNEGMYVCMYVCMSCHVMSCHVMSCHVMSCHVMSCYAMFCNVM